MQQPEPEEALAKDLPEVERRFAELLRRFWRRPDPDEQGDKT
jgi:hypothetical protein